MSKKITSKQMTEIHNHQKRHGVSFEDAKRAVLGGYGDASAERAAFYAQRRAELDAQLSADFAVATAMLLDPRLRRGGRR